ncbi:MAG: hypothetical protein EHM31_12335, partial [Candidatus Aminicenantes bacterium]
RYADLIEALYPLVDKGLAAAVYTQTSDCEIEVNGLMTYDREIIKLDPARFSTLNRGFLPPQFLADQTLFTGVLHSRARRPAGLDDPLYGRRRPAGSRVGPL